MQSNFQNTTMNFRIITSSLLFSVLSARAATTLESGEFFVDLRESPRVSAGTESLTYSTRWAGADALAGCTRKVRLTVTGYAGAETLEDVPILVRLSTAIQGFDYNDFAAPVTGADLVFCDESETTVYPHEIDEWNTNGESLVWVRLPALAAGTAFKMGYGGMPATAADVADAAHAVWSDYAGVWHMNEDSGTAFDSTANRLNATPTAGTNSLSDVTQMIAHEQGAVGRARVNASQALIGGNHLTVPNYDSCGLGGTFVVSGWFHADTDQQFYPKLFWRNWATGGWGAEFKRYTVSNVTVVGGGNSKTVGVQLNTSVADDWSWICIAYNGTSASFYQNGVLVTSGAILAVTDNGNVLTFGGVEGGTDSTAFVGQYDELRLRGGTLSADRVRADYDIVANPGFVTCGAVESIAGSGLEIRLGGEVFAGDLAGEGTVPWTATGPGTYEFEHVSLVDGAAVATESATFVVPGPTTNDLSILAEGDLLPGVAVRLGGAPDGWTLHYTTNGSNPTADSPVYTGPFVLDGSATVKVVATSDAHGRTSGVAEQRFDLAPPLAVTGARARQRYPWNGLVDVDFTLEGDAARRYHVTVVAEDLDGGTNLAARTVWEDRGSVTNAALDVAPGAHRFVWNAGADLPEGFVADRVAVSLRAESIHDTALYLVVDLSGGPDAEHYPVSYLPDVPEVGWTDEYKTDKLVLRRLEPGTRETCGEPMFAAVFETTQGQFLHLTGTNTTPDNLLGTYRPVATKYADVIRLAEQSGIRAKTGLSGLGLPATNQWEYACRAGTVSQLNNGKDISGLHDCPNACEVARYCGNSGWIWSSSEQDTVAFGTWDGTGGCDRVAEVGAYNANAWGLSDMHGNAWEWCSDADEGNHAVKGGSWNSNATSLDPANVAWYAPDVVRLGFRLFLHNAPAVVEAPIVAPAGLTATTNRTGDVALSWEPVAGAYAYQIRRSKTGAFEDGTWLNTVTNTTYADWTTESRADYAYWVRAQFESGRVGVWSEATEGSRGVFKVRFNANGGSGTMADQVFEFGVAQALSANAFTKTSASFLGWATSANGVKVYNDKQSVSDLSTTAGDIVTLYAVWKTLTAQNAQYMVIDLSKGSNASSYPVIYLETIPAGGWTDEYKTTKLAFRKVGAGSFTMGSPTTESGRGSNETQHKVTLSKPFFMSIFELTQRQYALIAGGSSTSKKPVGLKWTAVRGDDVTYKETKELANYHVDQPADYRYTWTFSATDYCWPNKTKVLASSLVGKLRARTGLSTIDLPTEAQWEYACRGGPSSSSNYGGSVGYSSLSDVGSKTPNSLGLYDMIGNAKEWSLDVCNSNSAIPDYGSGAKTNPTGETAKKFWYSLTYRYGDYPYPTISKTDYGTFDWYTSNKPITLKAKYTYRIIRGNSSRPASRAMANSSTGSSGVRLVVSAE